MCDAAQIVILPGLGHQEKLARQFLPPDLLREAGEGLPDPGYFPVMIEEDFSVGGLEKGLFRHGEPLGYRQDPVRGADPVREELRRAEHAAPWSAYGLEQGA